MSYPLVRDLAAEGIPVRLTCGVLGHCSSNSPAVVVSVRGRLPLRYVVRSGVRSCGPAPM